MTELVTTQYPEPKYQIGQKVFAADQIGEIGQILNPWRAGGRTEYIYLIRFPGDGNDWMWHPYELEEPNIVLADEAALDQPQVPVGNAEEVEELQRAIRKVSPSIYCGVGPSVSCVYDAALRGSQGYVIAVATTPLEAWRAAAARLVPTPMQKAAKLLTEMDALKKQEAAICDRINALFPTGFSYLLADVQYFVREQIEKPDSEPVVAVLGCDNSGTVRSIAAREMLQEMAAGNVWPVAH